MRRADILVTGASGFVGRSLLLGLQERHFFVRGCVRQLSAASQLLGSCVEVGDLKRGGDWGKAVEGIRCVIHLAGRAHMLTEKANNSLAEFRKVNVDATSELARQAVQCNVKRFVFVSSIGVNGNQNIHPFKETDEPKPVDPYAVSKYEAEQALTMISKKSGMELVIIRPPLVYGPNAPGNFGRLLRWIDKGIPLPLGAIHNKRSLVALDSLINFIITCIDHPAAANQIFLVADGEDMSTTDLLRRVGIALGKPARLFPVPVGLLQMVASLLGKRAIVQRLCGSLQVDITKARELLDWIPPVSVDEGLRRAAKWGSLQKA